MAISISVPEDLDFKPKISVVGVGGGGCNAVDHMIESKLEGVSFVACNTDLQALRRSSCPVRVRLGLQSTQGLGAGSNPLIGREAAEESLDEVMDAVGDAHMLFIVAGFGGGTGTGAAPVITRAAHERGILTVAVVTTPFAFEAVNRTEIAQEGLQELQQTVDTFVVISNQKLFDVQTEGMSLLDSFGLVDNVLYDGVRGITDLLMCPGLINLDFADVRSAMKDAGAALMGTGEATGENKIEEATTAAINNPLLNYQGLEMDQATSLVVNITSSANVSLTQTEQIMEIIRGRTHERVNLKVGVAIDDDMGDTIRVSVVMAGLDREHGSVLERVPNGVVARPASSQPRLQPEPLVHSGKPNGYGSQELPHRFGRPPSGLHGAESSVTAGPTPAPQVEQGGLDIGGPAAAFPEPPVRMYTDRSNVPADRLQPTPCETVENRTSDPVPQSIAAEPKDTTGCRPTTAVEREYPPAFRPSTFASGVQKETTSQGTNEIPVKAVPFSSGLTSESSEDASTVRTEPTGRDAPTRPHLAGDVVSRWTADSPEDLRVGAATAMRKEPNGSSNATAPEGAQPTDSGNIAQLRPAVHVGSKGSGQSAGWKNFFGLMPGRRKSENDRLEPSLEFATLGAAGPGTEREHRSVSDLSAPQSDHMDRDRSWASAEPVSARAVLGVDPRQIPSFRK